MKLRLIAAAKVNWTLEVLARRDDGYHEISTLLQTISLHDSVTLSPAATLELRLSGQSAAYAGPLEDDLAYRAALALREESGRWELGALIELAKRIPAAAGLGGGSSDAAAVLRGLNRLWGLGLVTPTLQRIGARLGSDVPFFLSGGTAQAGGRGDEIAPLPDAPTLPLLIAVPHAKLERKTARMYGLLRPEHYTNGDHTQTLAQKLAAGGAPSDEEIFNVFEAALPQAMPVAADLLEALRSLGLRPHLAGSGPALFFLSPDADEARRLRQYLAQADVELFEMTTVSAADSASIEEL